MTKRYASIWFPHLATDWFAAKQPQLKKIAFVLKASSHNRIIVTAANPVAQAKGVAVGMTLADARAVLPSLQDFDDKPTLKTQLLQQIAGWFIRFTPSAAPEGPEGVLLDTTGCTHLWGGEEAYIADIAKRLATRGYTARIAIADTIGMAWAVARFGKGQCVVASGCNHQALLHLPPAALRLEPAVIERLHKLGLHTINSFITMPRSALRRRFGTEIIKCLAQALGEVEEFFIPIHVLQPHQERLPCLEPIVTRTGIEIALERLLQLLCKRLTKEGKGLRTAYFRCYRMDSSAQGIEISTSRPSQNEEHLFHLFSLKLSALEPQSGIELFVLEATKVEKYVSIQESIWETSGRLDNEKLAELIDRIEGKFGPDVIHRFIPAEHHWPERSYQASTSLTKQRPLEWKTDKPRPLRMLTAPERIDVTAPIPDYPPMNFRYAGKLHTIRKADGPERIEQEWWIAEGNHRDYYAVEDEDGKRYWLFRSGHYTGDKSHQWYIHGFFA